MLSRVIDTADARALCAAEESHFFDHKSAAATGVAVQKALVAFANADGGELVVGIDDAATNANPLGRWNGLGQIEDFNGVLQAVNGIEPQIPCCMSFIAAQGMPGYVLQVTVDKSSQVHKTSAGDVYVRKGAQSLPVRDADQLVALKFAKGLASFEDVTVPTVEPERVVDSPELTKFLTDFSPKTNPLEFCVNENLVDVKTWDPRVSGLVLFSVNPSNLIPSRAGVRITRYETREDDPERDHLARSELLEAPAYPLIYQALERITDLMSGISIWTVDGLKKVAYPPEAIWEVVVNAIIHRDYSIADDIQVKIFDNRIEVQSPGKLPGFVTLQNILDVRYSRNRQIVRTLARYKEAPNKDMGEGLNTAFQKMKEWKLRDPIIEEVHNSVLVTIPHTPLAKPEELVLEFVQKNGTITNRQGREITGIKSENAMKNVFYALRDAAKIEMIPKGSKTEWRIKE